MATKTVSLSETAYEKLRKMKKEGESFSELVNRMTSERSLTEIAGIWKNEELRNAVEKNREKTEKELDKTAERLSQ